MRKNIFVSVNISIKEALNKMNSLSEKCLLVVNKNKILKGTLTDGDIRKSILKNLNLNKKIQSIFNKKPKYLFKDNWKKIDATKIFKKTGTNLIPLINKDKVIIDYLKWEDMLSPKNNLKKISRNTSAVIMAGGKGTRLEPFSNILPKPLIPINGIPFINLILDNFEKSGIKKIFITVNYKSSILKAYFQELKNKNDIKIIEEKKPLGTIGSLFLIKNKLTNPFILSNCDTLVNLSINELLNFHKNKKNDLTIVAAVKNYNLPYGYCKIDKNGNLEKMVEKPSYNFLINTGFYVFNKKIVKIIPKNKNYDFDIFLKDLKKKNFKVGVYPLEESSWDDIGVWKEFSKTVKKLNND